MPEGLLLGRNRLLELLLFQQQAGRTHVLGRFLDVFDERLKIFVRCGQLSSLNSPRQGLSLVAQLELDLRQQQGVFSDLSLRLPLGIFRFLNQVPGGCEDFLLAARDLGLFTAAAHQPSAGSLTLEEFKLERPNLDEEHVRLNSSLPAAGDSVVGDKIARL